MQGIESGALGPLLTLALLVFGLLLLILWVLLPFAVFGIKAKLNEALAELRRTNQLLAESRPTPPIVIPPTGGTDP